jgi:hypothetical protein
MWHEYFRYISIKSIFLKDFSSLGVIIQVLVVRGATYKSDGSLEGYTVIFSI